MHYYYDATAQGSPDRPHAGVNLNSAYSPKGLDKHLFLVDRPSELLKIERPITIHVILVEYLIHHARDKNYPSAAPETIKSAGSF